MSRAIDGAAIVVWNCCAWVIWLAAIVEVARTPAASFARGWRTKISRFAIISLIGGAVAGIYLPIGAAVVLAGLRRTRHQNQAIEPASPQGPQLPRHPGGLRQGDKP